MQQQSEAFHRELQEIYTARVADSFGRARDCLSYARMAHQEGDTCEVRKWLWCVRVLRMAAAGWRRRAQAISPVMLLSLMWLAGCATVPPVRVTDAVSLPNTLVSDACEEGYTREPFVLFEHAEVVFYEGIPWGLGCDLYDFTIADHRRTLVELRRSTIAVNRIRAYLLENGVPVPLKL